MDNDCLTVEVIENDLILSGIGTEQIRIPLSEVHNELEILKGSVRIHSSTDGWIEREWNADKAAELSVKHVKVWFAVPHIQTCHRNEISTPVQKVEMSADGFALLEGDKRTAVTPENLARMSLYWTIFGRNPRCVNIPAGPVLILPQDKQTIFGFTVTSRPGNICRFQVPIRM